jgi:hypothetical protein
MTEWPNVPEPRAEWTEIALAMTSRLRTCTEAKEGLPVMTVRSAWGKVEVGSKLEKDMILKREREARSEKSEKRDALQQKRFQKMKTGFVREFGPKGVK